MVPESEAVQKKNSGTKKKDGGDILPQSNFDDEDEGFEETEDETNDKDEIKKPNPSSKNPQTTTKASAQPTSSSAKKPSSPAAPPKQSSQPRLKPSTASVTFQKPNTTTPPRIFTGRPNPPKGTSPTPKSTQARVSPARKSTSPQVTLRKVTPPARKPTPPKVTPPAKKPPATVVNIRTGAKPATPPRKSPSPPARTQRSATPSKTQSSTPAQAVLNVVPKLKGIPTKVPSPRTAAAAKQQLDPEIIKKANQLKKNVEALAPGSFLSALTEMAKTSPDSLESVSSQLQNVIKSLEGTQLKNYFKALNSLINVANEN